MLMLNALYLKETSTDEACTIRFIVPSSGADPGFLKRGFICVKVWGFALLILSNFYSISHENVSLRPNYFIFMGYLKTRVGKCGSSEPPEPPCIRH